MKDKSSLPDEASRNFTRHASLVATFVAAAALALVPPAFAQTGGDTAEDWEPSMVPNQAEAEDPGAPSFEEPWDDGAVMTPAPQQPVEPEPGSMYVAPPPVGLIEPWGHPAISPTSPTLIAPDSFARPATGYSSPLR